MSEHLPKLLLVCMPTRALGAAVLTSLSTSATLLGCVCRCSVDQKVKVVAEAKIPKAADASKHKAGGGNVEIRQPSSTDNSLSPPLKPQRELSTHASLADSRVCPCNSCHWEQSIASWTGRLRPRFRRPQTLPSTKRAAATSRFVS